MTDLPSILNSIVAISSADARNPSVGSGFVVHQAGDMTYLVTCAHVVEQVGGVAQVLAQGVPAMVVRLGAANDIDLAVLAVSGFGPRPALALAEVAAGAIPAAIAGFFPLGKFLGARQLTGTLGTPFVLQTAQERQLQVWYFTVDGPDELRTGYSGSPVLDRANGTVIGVATHADQGGKRGRVLSIGGLRALWPDRPASLLPGPGLAPSLPQAPAPLNTAGPLPPHHQRRAAELARLRSAVLNEDAADPAAITAVWGMPGIGKSVLALALCHDAAVQQRFYDGIFWIKLGRDPGSSAPQIQVIGQLLVANDSPHYYSTELGATSRLRELLANRSVLIVLDDVWDIRHVHPFLVQAPASHLLLTTRQREIVLRLDAREVTLGVLEAPQAVALLCAWAGKDDPALPMIASRLGYLPLALQLAGARLRASTGQQWLQDFIHASLLTAGRYAKDAADSMTMCIELSIHELNTADQALYFALGIFPEDLEIPVAVILRLWQRLNPLLSAAAGRELLNYLADAALLTRADDGTQVRLHDVLHDYNVVQLEAQPGQWAARHRALLEAFNPEGRPWPSIPNDPDGYLYAQLAYHLREAGQGAELRALLFDFAWLRAKLAAVENPIRLMGDYDLAMTEAEQQNRRADLHLVKQAIQLSVHLLAEDKSQLWEQLYGRLLLQPSPQIQAMLRVPDKSVWLRPLDLYLMPPNSALLQTLRRDPQAGRAAGITALAVDWEGRAILAGCTDGTLNVWHLQTGRLAVLPGHRHGLTALSRSRDTVITGGYDRLVKVWQQDAYGNYAVTRTLPGHAGSVLAVTLSADGALAASGDQTGLVKVWDMQAGTERATLRGHAGAILALVVAPDGKTLISGAYDRTIRVWDLDTGRAVHILQGHHDAVLTVAVHEDTQGGFVLSGSADETLKVWDLARGRELRTWAAHAGWVRAIALSADGQTAASGSYDNSVRIWDLGQARPIRQLKGHADRVMAVALRGDKQQLISGAYDGALKVWDLTDDQAQPAFLDYGKSVMTVAVSQDGRRGICGVSDGSVQVWDLVARQRLAKYESGNIVRAVALTAPGTTALVGYYKPNPILCVWDLEHGQIMRTLAGHRDNVRVATISADGRLGVSGSFDATIKVWDLDTGRELRLLTDHTDHVCALALAPDTRRLFSGSRDTTIKVWDLAAGRAIETIGGHSDHVLALALSPDGTTLFSAANDGQIKVWNVATWTEIGPPDLAHTSPVWTLALSRDGTLLLAGSNDGRVRVWDWRRAALLAQFCLEGPIYSAAFAADNGIFLGGGASGAPYFLRLEGYSIV